MSHLNSFLVHEIAHYLHQGKFIISSGVGKGDIMVFEIVNDDYHYYHCKLPPSTCCTTRIFFNFQILAWIYRQIDQRLSLKLNLDKKNSSPTNFQTIWCNRNRNKIGLLLMISNGKNQELIIF